MVLYFGCWWPLGLQANPFPNHWRNKKKSQHVRKAQFFSGYEAHSLHRQIIPLNISFILGNTQRFFYNHFALRDSALSFFGGTQNHINHWFFSKSFIPFTAVIKLNLMRIITSVIRSLFFWHLDYFSKSAFFCLHIK